MNSELVKRVSVAVLGIPFALALAFVGRWPFALFIMVISMIATGELITFSRQADFSGSRVLAQGLAGVLPLLVHLFGPVVLIAFLPPAMILIAFEALFHHPVRVAFRRAVISLYALNVIAIPLSTMVLLRDASQWVDAGLAGGFIIYLLAGVWVADTAAYFVGRKWGRRPLAPEISPKKTIEGSIASLVAALLYAAFITSLFGGRYTLVDRLVFALIIGGISQVGDLAQSMAKRVAGEKDSGRLLPGHGGVYDRFDSIIFVAPAMYLYLLATAHIPLF